MNRSSRRLPSTPNGLGPRGRACTGARWLRRGLGVRTERGRDRLTWLDGLVEVAQRELECAEERDHVRHRHETHVTDAEQLTFELALAAGDDRVVVLA